MSKTPEVFLSRRPSDAATVAPLGRSVPVIYGTDRVQAIVTSYTAHGDKMLMVCIWCVGEIDGINGLTANDNALPSDYVVRHYLGTTDQQPDPVLSSAVGGYSDRMVASYAGGSVALAYSVIEVPSTEKSIPIFTATIRGKKVYDPRISQTVFTDNPALCLADYIQSTVYGQGWICANITEAANTNDELVNGKHRRSIGISVNTDRDDTPEKVVEVLRAYAGCFVAADGLRRKLIPDRPASAIGTITSDNVRPGSFKRTINHESQVTVSNVTFRDTSGIPWRDGVATSYADGALEGLVPWVEESADMAGITDADMASREAQERRLSSELSTSIEFQTHDQALKYQQGDLLSVNAYGVDDVFRIMIVDPTEPGRYKIKADQYSADAYPDESVGVEVTLPPITPLFDSMDEPNMGGVTSGGGVYVEGADGTVFNRIRVDLSPPSSANFSHFEIRFRVSGSGAAWQSGQVVGTTAYLFPVQDGLQYEFESRSIGLNGAESDWNSSTHIVEKKNVPPPAPSGLSVTVSPSGMRKVTFNYGTVPGDFAGFRIQYDAGSGYVDLLEGLTQQRVIETEQMPAGDVTIRVHAQDRSGNTSGWIYDTSNIAQDPDGLWYDVDARIEAEKLRNDTQDGTISYQGTTQIPAAQSTADGAQSTGDYLQNTVIPPIDVQAGDAWDKGVYLEDTKIPPIEATAGTALSTATTADNKSDTNSGEIVVVKLDLDTEESKGISRDSTLSLHGFEISEAQSAADAAHDAAIVADQKAAQALQDAAANNQEILDLSTTVDGKIESYYQNESPANPDTGDLWIDTNDGNKLHWWSGIYWQDAQDTDINQALVAAANANQAALDAATLADSKIESFFQGSAPAGASVGDLWIDTSNGNKVHRYDGAGWVDAQDSEISLAVGQATQALDDAALAQATADGKIVTYHQASQPTADGFGDIWLDSDDGNKMYRWDGSSWNPVQDNAIATAISAASTAQATADGKVVTYRQSSQPTAEGVGDLWIDSDDNNHIYRWDGTSWIDSHDPNVFASLQLAQDAYNLADGKIDVFYQTAAPSTPDIGDLWVDTSDGNALTRWSGSTWESVGAGDAAAALVAANNAQDTADGKVATFFQTANPAAEGVGDLWFDTNDKNKAYRWSGSAWQLVRDADIAQALTDAAGALTQANAAFNLADGKIESYYQNSSPSGADTGDLWIDKNDNNKLYRWSGSSWVSAQDSRIAQAINDASTAQATADGKVVTFYQSGTPTAEGVGDLWVRTGQGNKLYRWSGSSWVVARDSGISAAQSAADSAIADASSAQNTANSANSKANNAQSTANSAYNEAFNGIIPGSRISVSTLSAITSNLGTINAGRMNFADGGYIDLDSTGTLIVSGNTKFLVQSNGDLRCNRIDSRENLYVDGTAQIDGRLYADNGARIRFNTLDVYDGANFYGNIVFNSGANLAVSSGAQFNALTHLKGFTQVRDGGELNIAGNGTMTMTSSSVLVDGQSLSNYIRSVVNSM